MGTRQRIFSQKITAVFFQIYQTIYCSFFLIYQKSFGEYLRKKK